MDIPETRTGPEKGGGNRIEIIEKSRIESSRKGRRNLTDFVKFELSKVKADILAEKGREIKVTEGKKARDKQIGVLSIVDKTPESKPHDTRKEIAKDLGWSTGKVAMAKVVTYYVFLRKKYR